VTVPQRRAIILAAVWLVAGIAINIALAWGLAAWETRRSAPLRQTLGVAQLPLPVRDLWEEHFGPTIFVDSFNDVARWNDLHPAPLPGDPVPRWIRIERLHMMGVDEWRLTDQIISVYLGMTIVDTGWPLRSMRSVLVHRGQGSSELHGGLIVDAGAASDAILPTAPLRFGFLANSLLSAAVLLGLTSLSVALRRAKRRRRGLCAACGYPVGTSPVCTECGAPISRGAPRGLGGSQEGRRNF